MRENLNLSDQCADALDNLNDTLLWVNQQGDIMAVNNACATLLGQSKDYLYEHQIFKYVREISILTWESYWRKLLNGEKIVQECRVENRHGVLRAVQIKIQLVDHNGPLAFIIIHDIPSTINDNRRLKRVSYEYDHLMYKTSHDLKAPISTILGLVDLIKRDANSQQMECLSLIEATMKKQNDLMEDINHLALIDSAVVDLGRIDIQTLVSQIIYDLRLEKSGVEINCEYDIDSPFTSDTYLIEKCLSPLIHNAVKYKSAIVNSRVDLKVKVNQNNLTIDVKDNGIGINSNLEKKIFEMFFRGSELSTGSGLGLYLSLITAHKLNGHVELISTSKNGSFFQLVIPNMFLTKKADHPKRQSA
ncbi:PAS domain-containing sensor histidine kinase [Fulvivirga ligni]|uniref:PAS domain-containing sensor histidine kinase n=1 Tax=Fulvivirga ligni TaxID=2904246 RepID=UPI001F41F7FB|nr:PAS domain-containing sensor histidine kinase [Fulvivirga ligni]UII20453.1 PAS domain-containing sensor histidine kinase [Fulvivirga ligni]